MQKALLAIKKLCYRILLACLSQCLQCGADLAGADAIGQLQLRSGFVVLPRIGRGLL